jgi:hypothetical protein
MKELNMSEKRSLKTYPDSTVQTLEPEAIDSSEVSDAQLLKNFRSSYQDMDPALYVGDPRRPVSELLERDKRIFLARQRGMLARAKAEKERAEQEQAKRDEALERAKKGEARAALKVAVEGYKRWTDKRLELAGALADREAVLAGLLVNQPEQINLEALRAHSSQVGDCRLMIDALKSQIQAWENKHGQYVAPLRQALANAGGEFAILHEVERGKRLSAAKTQLEAIIDLNHLTDLQFNSGAVSGRLPELAEAGWLVIALDRVISLRGSHPWQYSGGDSQLPERANTLEKHFLLLENEIAAK